MGKKEFCIGDNWKEKKGFAIETIERKKSFCSWDNRKEKKYYHLRQYKGKKGCAFQTIDRQSIYQSCQGVPYAFHKV